MVKATPRVERVLKRAEAIAGSFGHDYLGTEHLLIAIATDNGGVASHVLSQLGVSESVVAEVGSIIASEGYGRQSPHPTP